MNDSLIKRLSRLKGLDYQIPAPVAHGQITRMIGLTLEAVGIKASMGEYCLIYPDYGEPVEAEVVGFSGDRIYLMPIDQLEGLAPGARVSPLAGGSDVQVGFELLGRVINGVGKPLDSLGELGCKSSVPLQGRNINPLNRQPIKQTLDVGIRAINSLLSVGRGQRLGLFAGSGVGKSVLLGMMTRFTEADIVVVGLIGERGREVKEFIDQSLGEEGMRRAVVVASPADESPLMRLRAAQLATRLAEYFREQGKHVLLLMDSLTRYAQAQREIALAVGEPPATKGYPPSVFAKLPKLVERAGNGDQDGGSITAFYTVLTEGDDQQDPIADSARAILDGHIVLSRSLAERGHYPAIDIEQSISRAMPQVVSSDHLKAAMGFKQLYSKFQQNQDLISIGAYVRGSDAETDFAIERMPLMNAFLQQGLNDPYTFQKSLKDLAMVLTPTPSSVPGVQQGQQKIAMGNGASS